MKPVKYIFYNMIHPIEGVEDMRWSKAGRLGYALIIIIVWFLAVIAERQLTGAAVNYNRLDRLNILILLLRTVVLFVLWITANWGFCTLLEGEGSYRNIAIVSAYALAPYIIALILSTIISRFITQDELIFIVWLRWLGIVWSGMMMLSSLKVIHNYSFPKTVSSVLLTFAGIAIIIFIMVLLFSLYQQVYAFIMTLFSEVMYRI